MVMGIINYEFIPNLTEITSPLIELLKKNVIYNWNWSHEKAIGYNK